MKETRIIMGMPIEIEIVDTNVPEVLEVAFARFTEVDSQFSIYKEDSEISRINQGEITLEMMSAPMREVFALAEKTRMETAGYFDMHRPDNKIDPSGVVKGWAILDVANRIQSMGCKNYLVNAGGDIAISGVNAEGEEWSIGIRNPFNIQEVVKVVYPHGKGVATSGSYIRGDHIYNPHSPGDELNEIVSITVIGPDVLEADRFATAAFAMGKLGIEFIERLQGFEGYAIDKNGVATMTSGFEAYTRPS